MFYFCREIYEECETSDECVHSHTHASRTGTALDFACSPKRLQITQILRKCFYLGFSCKILYMNLNRNSEEVHLPKFDRIQYQMKIFKSNKLFEIIMLIRLWQSDRLRTINQSIQMKTKRKIFHLKKTKISWAMSHSHTKCNFTLKEPKKFEYQLSKFDAFLVSTLCAHSIP